MTALPGHDRILVKPRSVARQRCLRRTLERDGILDRRWLYTMSGAEHWNVPFECALERAIASGRVRRLYGGFYAAGPVR
jgi:hypothetical protein